MMRNFLKTTILMCLMLMFSMNIAAQKTTKQYDWSKVINAIIQVESGGNPNAYNPNGDCAGILQITPILVRECNQILEKKKSTKRYTYKDRYDVKKSKEMFILIQEYHNPTNDIEKAIKCWNCGSFYVKGDGWKQKSVDYYNKVMKYYNNGGK